MKMPRWILPIGLGVLVLGVTIVSTNATSSPFSSLPFAKQQMENNYAKLKQQSYVAPKSSDTSLKPVQHDSLPSGILTEFTPPFRSDDVTVQNVWQKEMNGQLVQVYAGKVSGDAMQGIVIVQSTSADGATTQEQRFMTKKKMGSLKIEAESNFKLTLKSDQGTNYEFDVVGKALTEK